MRIVLQIISAIALGLTIIPSLLFFSGRMELDMMKWLILLATIVWFIVTPLWMGRKDESPQAAE